MVYIYISSLLGVIKTNYIWLFTPHSRYSLSSGVAAVNRRRRRSIYIEKKTEAEAEAEVEEEEKKNEADFDYWSKYIYI